MCSWRVRKLTGLIRNQVLPLSSVVEIQKRPLCSTRCATSACSFFDAVSLNPLRLKRIQIADMGGRLAASNSGSAAARS